MDYQFLPELWNKKTRVFKVAKYVRQYKPDVVISFLPSVNKTMCLAKMFFGAKLVVSERNNNTCITRSDKVQFNLYRMADAIVPNSNSQGKFISKNFPFLSKKVHPIINFVDVNRFTPSETPVQNDVFGYCDSCSLYSTEKCLDLLEGCTYGKGYGTQCAFRLVWR